MQVERLLQLAADVVEAPRLVTVAGRLGIPVHGIADPQDPAPVALHRVEQRRLADAMLPALIRWMKASRPGSSSGFSVDQARSSWSGATDGPTFTAIGLRMPRKYSKVRALSACMPIHG